MSDLFFNLTQGELLALALEAVRRKDSGYALAYLKEAARREDASAQALFMLGSEYAQIGLIKEAKASMARALSGGEEFPLARFQLGLLHATTQELDAAEEVWLPLAALGEHHPEVYLASFQRGMLHFIAEEFAAAIQVLGNGIALNQKNSSLNAEMRRVIDAAQHLSERKRVSNATAAPTSNVTVDAPAVELPNAEGYADPSHLFISAYTQIGKPH